MAQETLLGQSTIWLFGREMADIKIIPKAYNKIPDNDDAADAADTPVQRGGTHNNLLLSQLSADGATLARIYAFSYQGAFYDLPRPTIFVVHGRGIDPEGSSLAPLPDQATLSRMPAASGRTGLGSMGGSFTGEIRVWAYDRADFTARLDIETGSFDTVLLAMEIGTGDPAAQSAGSVARAAGSVARSAGSVARAAGSVARGRRNPNGSNE